MVKILITTIQVNLVPLGQLAQNSPELSLLKFLPLTYHHSHFLAATLDFTSFFTMAFLGGRTFFTAWLFLIRFLIQLLSFSLVLLLVLVITWVAVKFGINTTRRSRVKFTISNTTRVVFIPNFTATHAIPS